MLLTTTITAVPMCTHLTDLSCSVCSTAVHLHTTACVTATVTATAGFKPKYDTS
jgi:hypothetical protein